MKQSRGSKYWVFRGRLDPVLEPIGFGFAASLGRYLDVRERYPKSEMMMGIGNLTELTDVDSAGVNTLLLGFCQETGIRSVLTTEVIHWSKTSVKECDLARALVYHAVTNKTLAKACRATAGYASVGETAAITVTTRLNSWLWQFVTRISEYLLNVVRFILLGRIFIWLHGIHFNFFINWRTMVEQMLTPNHAFYLGYEMAKAVTALTLGKDYRQDQALDWGYLTGIGNWMWPV